MAAVAQIIIPRDRSSVDGTSSKWSSGFFQTRGSRGSGDDDLDPKLAGVPRELRPAFEEVAKLPIIEKIDLDKFEEIALGEVETLLTTLGPNEEGNLKLKLIRLLLMTQLKDACSDDEVDLLLKCFADRGTTEEDIFVSAAEIHSELTKGENLAEFKRTRRIKRGLGPEVTRTLLLDRLVELTDRNDALLTLPITMIYVLLFVVLVMGHLRIYNRQQLEHSMEEYVNGRDPRETADENVDDIDSWWEWVQGAGTSGPLGKVKNSTTTGYPYCLMASRNVLLGDVMLKSTKFDGTETSQWLLHSSTGEAFLQAHATSSTRFLDAARSAAQHLQDNGWSDPQIEIMQLRFNSYNEYARMFGITEVTIPLRDTGAVTHKINTDAVSVEPYPEFHLYVVDALFFLLVFWIFVQELRDACGSLKLGCGEFLQYWQFWNCVDWINIIMSMSSAGLWLAVVGAMNSSNLGDLINDDYKLKVDVTKLTESQLNSIDDSLILLRNLYIAMQWTLAVNTASVVMKFFKAFTSNPLLKVVSDTFNDALQDFIHFFIIFSTIFLPFTIIGHILFGSDVTEFASVISSINTGFVVLMGEFGWYVDMAPRKYTSTLPSGMPSLVLFLWYFTYMFLVLLVLLNMLLAIIIEHYLEVEKKVEHTTTGRETIKAQVEHWWQFRKETKNFVSLEEMRRAMENDEDPAHRGGEVTKSSLEQEEKFSMSSEQADWLMDHLQKYQKLKAEKEVKGKSEKLAELAEMNSNRLALVTEVVLGNKSKIDQLVSEANDAKTVKGTPESTGDDAKLAATFKSLEGLISSVGKIRDDQRRLGRRVEDLSVFIPQELPIVAVAGGGGPRKIPDSADAPTPPEVAIDKPPKESRTKTDATPRKDREERPRRRKPSNEAVARKT